MNDLATMIREQAEATNRMFRLGHDTGYIAGLRAGKAQANEELQKENERLRDEVFRLKARIAELASGHVTLSRETVRLLNKTPDPWYDRERFRAEAADERAAERAEALRAERDEP